MIGVTQLMSRGRSTFHTFLPYLVSTAAMNDSTDVVHWHDELVLHQNWRRRHADLVGDRRIVAHERAIPAQRAVGVEGGEVAGREQRVNAGLVGDRRVRGHARLRVARGPAGGLQLAVPELLAGCRVEANDVQPVVARAGTTRDIDFAARHDRRRHAARRQFGLPLDALCPSTTRSAGSSRSKRRSRSAP